MLWFVVNTDLTITTEKLAELLATTSGNYNHPMAYDNIMDHPVIGLQHQLDLPESKVAEIQRNYRSPSRRRDAYFDLYVTGHPCPSWRQVAEVFREVFLYNQADMVEITYNQGICTDT